MAEPSRIPLRIAVAAAIVVVAGFFAFLIGNVVFHAFHHSSKTPTATQVLSLKVLAPNELQITGSVTNLSASTATISCLIGVLEPGDPLAYPHRSFITLAAGQTGQITVTRTLLRPQAKGVRASNIPFTCT
jgi:hypothetical protein